MKATLAIATTKKLSDLLPGALFKFAHGDESKAICSLLSTDSAGVARPVWDAANPALQRIVVIASLRSPEEIGYRPTGALLNVNADMHVIPVEQIEPCAFREACLIG